VREGTSSRNRCLHEAVEKPCGHGGLWRGGIRGLRTRPPRRPPGGVQTDALRTLVWLQGGRGAVRYVASGAVCPRHRQSTLWWLWRDLRATPSLLLRTSMSTGAVQGRPVRESGHLQVRVPPETGTRSATASTLMCKTTTTAVADAAKAVGPAAVQKPLPVAGAAVPEGRSCCEIDGFVRCCSASERCCKNEGAGAVCCAAGLECCVTSPGFGSPGARCCGPGWKGCHSASGSADCYDPRVHMCCPGGVGIC
jgi:hypothetical protein